MKLSLVRLSRSVRPRKLLAGRSLEPPRSWSTETARLIEMTLRNEAPLPWTALSKYLEMPPTAQDASRLLPLLEKRAMAEFYETTKSDASRQMGVEAVGQFALSLDLLAHLSCQFINCWIRQLSRSNPFRALQVYKRVGNVPLEVGVELYLAAGQPRKAFQLAEQISNVPFSMVRKLIEYNAKRRDSKQAQIWVDKWQAPRPEDIRWLHHITNQHNLDLKLPELPPNVLVPPHSQPVSPRLQTLLSFLNQILANHPELLLDESIKSKWEATIMDPGRNSLQELAVAISKSNVPVDWMPVIRTIDVPCAIEIISQTKTSGPREFAALISRSNETELALILKIISPDCLYTPECLSSLALSSPLLFAQLAVPQEFLESQLKEHYLLAIWRSQPPLSVIEWLYPLTLSKRSPRLLRSAIKRLVELEDQNKIKDLLTNYIVTQRLEFDPKILKSGKLSHAVHHSNKSEEECRKEVDDILCTLFV